MGNFLSDGLREKEIMERMNIGSARGVISLVTLFDLVVIVPSIALFLAFNIGVMNHYGIPFLLFLLTFIIYLPLVIVSAGMFLSRKSGHYNMGVRGESVKTLLFFLLLFSLFGIYMPSIERLSAIIPAFQSLNIVGGAIVIFNLVFLLKNAAKIFKE